MTYALTVPGAPVAKGRPRFTRRGHTYTPLATRQAEWEIRAAWVAKYPDMAPLLGPLCLEAIFHMPQPKSVPKSRRLTAQPTTRPDVENICKVILDSLNKVAFRDDAQVVEVHLKKRYAIDSPVRTEIKLVEVVP